MLRVRSLSAAAFLVLATAAAVVAQSPAPDLSGSWKGSFVTVGESGTDEDEMYMKARQTGAELTGTAGPSPDQQWPIQKGKVATTKEGTTVTFDVLQVEHPPSDGPVIHFELKLVDGHLKGTAKAEYGGRKMNSTVDIQREK